MAMQRLIKQLSMCTLFISGSFLFSGCESPGPQISQPTTKQPSSVVATLSPIDREHYEKALNNLDQKAYKKSLKALQKLDKKHPNHLGVKINLATNYLLVERLDLAASTAQQALSINNTVAEVHNVLGLIAIEQKAYKKAETEYLLAVTLNKKLAEAHYNIALLYDVYFQDINKAYAYYNSYLELEPDDQKTRDWVDQLKYSLEQ
ncbi:MAG: hypothetical protein K6L80_04355 [Agarilytica sp.]